MAINPHVIPRKPHDKGAANSIAELTRRIRSIESKAGVIGAGATISGATVQTADSGQRVYMQGPLGSNSGGVGLFVTDSGNHIVMSLTPAFGLVFQNTAGQVVMSLAPNGSLVVYDSTGSTALVSLVPGQGLSISASNFGSWIPGQAIEWFHGSALVAQISGSWTNSPSDTGQINMWGRCPTNSSAMELDIVADATYTASYIQYTIYDSTGASRGQGIIADGTGAGSWLKGIGFYGTIPPASKPASPGTATGVDAAVINAIKAILQGYGMCA